MNPHYVVMSIVGGAQSGVAQAWQGVLSQVLGQVQYSSTRAGYVGCINVVAMAVGGVLAGPIVDRFFFRHYKVRR